MSEITSRYGGSVLARGGRYRILEGPETFERRMVVEFPTLEQAVGGHGSPEYQVAQRIRLNNVGENELGDRGGRRRDADLTAMGGA